MDDPRDLVTVDQAELSKRCRQLLDNSQDALDRATRLCAAGEPEAARIAMDEASASLAILADLTDAFESSVQADEAATQDARAATTNMSAAHPNRRATDADIRPPWLH